MNTSIPIHSVENFLKSLLNVDAIAQGESEHDILRIGEAVPVGPFQDGRFVERLRKYPMYHHFPRANYGKFVQSSQNCALQKVFSLIQKTGQIPTDK
jgi:GTPase